MPTPQLDSHLNRHRRQGIGSYWTDTAVISIGRWVRIPYHSVRRVVSKIHGRRAMAAAGPDAVDGDERRRELQHYLAPHALSVIHQTRTRRRRPHGRAG